MSSYHLTENNLTAYIKKLNSYKPQFLDGYPSTIYILAKKIISEEIPLTFTPIAISTTAETLFKNQRRIIEQAFNCKVFNQYASSEGNSWISECTKGKYHVFPESGIFEFLSSDSFENNLLIRELVVTSFRNYKTPLIRYRTGDYVEISSDQECSCGSINPIVKDIFGREDDILYTKEKGYVGRLDTAFKGLRFIKACQIVQESVDHITINIVKDMNYSNKIEKKLLENLKDRLGENVSYNIIYSNQIPLSNNGKFRSVINKVRR